MSAEEIVRRVLNAPVEIAIELVIVDDGNDGAVTIAGHGHAGILADRRARRL